MSSSGQSPDQGIHQQTLDRVSDAIVSVDTDLRYTYLNQSAEELLGKPQSELLGTVIWDAFPEAQDTIAQEHIESALRTNQETSYERYNESLDCWFEVRVFPDAEGLSIFFSDITDRKERTIELERYEQIIETLPVAVGQNTPGNEGEFEYVNQGMVEMFGLASKEEAKQYSPADLYANPEERKIFNERIQSNGAVHNFEFELEKPTGENFWGSATASVDTIDGEEYFIGVIQDITERKKYKQKLQDLHEATRGMVSALRPNDIADIVAQTADKSIGYEMNGVHLYDESVDGLVPASVSETSRELIGDVPVLDEGIAWTAFQTGETQVCNNLKTADNVYNEETVLQSELAIPLGNHGVLLASDTDVGAFRGDDLSLIKILAKNAETALNQLQTEEKLRNREQELERSRELLNQTARVAKVGGWEVDLKTDSRNWTDQIYRIYDKPPSETISMTDLIEAFHPEDRPKIRNAWTRLTSEGEPYDLELRLDTDAGNIKWVRSIGIPEYNDDGTEIDTARGIMQDVTERKEREQQLARQQEFLTQTQKVASIGGWEADTETETLRWTDEVHRIHGLPLDETPSIEEAITFYHPDERDTVRDAFEDLTTDGDPFDLEVRLITANDDIRWVRTRGEPWYRDGEVVGARGTFQDITERKHQEQKLQQQNSRLNEFAGVVSHDLRNPLNVAQSRATILKMRADEELQEHLDPLVTALKRMERIIEDTLTLARQGETVGEMTSIQIIELIGKCWEGVKTADATLEIDDEFTIRGDRDRLRHVFENLFRNAVEHGGEDVTVRIGRADEHCFYVEDDGPGIPPDNRKDVFESGYTSANDGTGFGLTIVNRIAEAHDWEVTVTEGRDGGARFEFDTGGVIAD